MFDFFVYLLGFLSGTVAIGFLANRRPEWFAKVVKVANTFDDSVNAGVSKLAPKASPPSTAPPVT